MESTDLTLQNAEPNKNIDSAAAEPVPAVGLSSGLFQFLFITGCIILFVLISKLYLDQYIEIRKMEQHLQQEKVKLIEANRERERLTRELSFLRTDDGIEKVAREKLRMVRPDEVIIVPVEPPKP